MAVTAHVFPNFAQKLGTNAMKASTDGVKAALIATSGALATFSTYEAQTTFAGLLTAASASEVSSSSTGYTTGGQALSSVTWTLSGLVSTLTATSPIVWTCTTNGFTAYYAVFYDTTAETAAGDLICYWDFGGASAVTPGGTFSLNISGGLVTATSS